MNLGDISLRRSSRVIPPALRIGPAAADTRPTPAAAAVLGRPGPQDWQPLDATSLRFDALHPQGMAIVDGRLWISTVDRQLRRGYLLCADRDGELLTRIALSGPGERSYHPGGMDFDGSALWIPLAEYNPGGRSVVHRIDLRDGTAQAVFAVDGHVGAAARIPGRDEIMGWSWGSQELSRWSLDGKLLQRAPNVGRLSDWQDVHVIDAHRAVVGGVVTMAGADGVSVQVGSLGVVSLTDLSRLNEVPFRGYSRTGRVGTYNPMTLEFVDQRLVLTVLPDDARGRILRYTLH